MTNKEKPVEPEEKKYETIVELSESDIEEIRQEARNRAATATHVWKQRGAYIVCTSCENEHAYYIGTLKRLKGFDKDGNAIFETRGEA